MMVLDLIYGGSVAVHRSEVKPELVVLTALNTRKCAATHLTTDEAVRLIAELQQVVFDALAEKP